MIMEMRKGKKAAAEEFNCRRLARLAHRNAPPPQNDYGNRKEMIVLIAKRLDDRQIRATTCASLSERVHDSLPTNALNAGPTASTGCQGRVQKSSVAFGLSRTNGHQRPVLHGSEWEGSACESRDRQIGGLRKGETMSADAVGAPPREGHLAKCYQGSKSCQHEEPERRLTKSKRMGQILVL